MTSILLKSGTSPFQRVSPVIAFIENAIDTNSGNLLFMHTAHKLLSAPGVQVITQGDKIRLHDPKYISENFSRYVIPLSNAFRVSNISNLENMTSLIEKLTIPVTILGVGAQAPANYSLSKLSALEKPVRRFVKAVLDHGPSIGVRGELTYDYLRNLGFRDIEVIGCPSMFYRGPNLSIRKKTARLTHDDPVTLTYSPYVEDLYDFTVRQYESFSNIVYIPQNQKDLALLLCGPKPLKIRNKAVHYTYPYYRDMKALLFLDPRSWMEYLSTRSFTFGTRIHGTIASLQAGTPAFLIAHDSRTLELARYFQIPHILLSDALKDDNPLEWHERADYTPLMNALPEKYAIFRNYMRTHGLDPIFDYPDEVIRYNETLDGLPFQPPVTGVPSDKRGNTAIQFMKSWRYKIPAVYKSLHGTHL